MILLFLQISTAFPLAHVTSFTDLSIKPEIRRDKVLLTDPNVVNPYVKCNKKKQNTTFSTPSSVLNSFTYVLCPWLRFFRRPHIIG